MSISEDLLKVATLLRKADASEYAAQIGKSRDVLFLEEESEDDPNVEIALKLLARMKKEIVTHGEKAIEDFRKNYLKQTGGGYFDTVVREAIARVYTDIADNHGFKDEANEHWH